MHLRRSPYVIHSHLEVYIRSTEHNSKDALSRREGKVSELSN
jgi:hypothetical protein